MDQDEGKCGVRNYPNITQDKINLMIAEMRRQGMTVTGANPWDVDVRQHGVKLRGTWSSGAQTLSVIVTDKNWYVPCAKIWETIDGLMPHIQDLADHEVAGALQALSVS
ncbi:MAG TPA: hypothetical protein VF469_32755 [Kofleriaceae bacterium]